ncbi:hypothetical protein ACQ4M3_07550 [Leptolyngbya sp. AN03gr2]|uniref:hypothetical protein n=1 Tax=unclassified Leptolyngbya TaxID=2650499 RepID=UPI003D32321E
MVDPQNENSGGYGQDSSEETGYGGTGYGGAGYGGTGNATNILNSPGYAADPNYFGESQATALGALQNPLVTERIENPLTENVFEFNPFDTAYTETLSNSNPQGAGYGQSDYASDDDQLQIEL